MNTAPSSAPAMEAATLRDRAASSRERAERVIQHSTLKERFSRGREYSAAFDFIPFSVMDLGRIYELARSAGNWWGSLGNMPLCSDYTGHTAIGWFVEFETERMAFLRDRCVAEITRRIPSDDYERDEILRVRIMHELDCNDRICSETEPGLLIAALKAWG